ncbi:hypothetical protein JWG45_10635 [Leptospira sp. 201903070]|uniref:Uncharacterized protein n=1 Tax=Leptospira ainlahdjerensis TaxID=2810033 RepID=A0ABS2UB80_9LEPT|nr:hypothetical protein [Leptospira ainlahdjerensis]MBM9577608.1 hypothetical protein [Leptospira ainlahdjerensis]
MTQSRLETFRCIGDIHQSIAIQTRWMFGAILGSVGLVFAIEKILHSIP